MGLEDLQFALEKLDRHFDVSEFASMEVDTESAFYQALKQRLTAVVERLIERDFDRLLQILYRIDVSEEKSGKALAKGVPFAIAEELADAIIQRQFQKLYTQNKSFD